MMHHEKIRIPPFGVLPIQPTGSIGLVAGNAPYVGITEGVDNMRLQVGQCVPLSTAKAELFNPYSFAFEGQIIRGAPINIGVQPIPYDFEMNERFVSGGVSMSVPADTTRRRGVGFMAKRGAYRVSFKNLSSAPVDSYQMILRGASASFRALKPAACFQIDNTFWRFDGSVNSEILSVAGEYSAAEISTWRAATGYTIQPEVFYPTDFTNGLSFDADTAVFFTTNSTGYLRFGLIIEELGDFTSSRRIVGGN